MQTQTFSADNEAGVLGVGQAQRQSFEKFFNQKAFKTNIEVETGVKTLISLSCRRTGKSLNHFRKCNERAVMAIAKSSHYQVES